MMPHWPALAVAGLAVVAGCSPAERTDTRSPQIVSLNPCVDAILAEIAPDQLVAISHYSHDPQGSSMPAARAEQYPSTSGSAEEVAALAPDLVVAGMFLPPATEKAFDDMGLKVVKSGAITNVDEAFEQIRDLAILTGRERAGERLISEIESALEASAPPPGARPIPVLVWQSGGLVPGEVTLISDLLSRVGFANWSAGRGLGQGAIVPLEQVVADPPPLILVAGSGGEENRKLHHPALSKLKGVEQAEMVPNLLFCGGTTIPKTVRRLAEIRDGFSQ